MFKDLSPEEDNAKTRLILEHELRAAIRIIGYLLQQHGTSGNMVIPHSVLGTDFRVSVQSRAIDNKITLKSWVHDAGQAS